ncbi:lipopolysaccharide biosynthesis protein [Acetobacter cibinongensis]|uniref:lipopolysaccharide biosynthesis protein n=1 Tax=Acetobacter cibinongensis TaxID=146475 RepID=UPI0013FDA464|nr:oligosaccharide flippase family protein [Acetobacter cibinongensis]
MSQEKGKTAFSRIISNTSIIVLGRVLNAVCSFIYIPWTVQTIGLTGFGQLLLITSYLMLVSDITHLHSWQPLLHFGTSSYKEKNHREFHQILGFCMRSDFISGLTGMIVGIGGVMLFSRTMGWPDTLRTMAELTALTILVMNRGWPVGVMRMMSKFKVATTIELAGTLTRTIGSFIGFELGKGLPYFLAVWGITQLVLFLLYNTFGIYLVRKNISTSFPLQELFMPTVKIRGIWKLTLGTSFSEILESFFKQISTLLIGAWMGAADAAIFRVATQITNAIAKPATMLIPAIYPEFIRFRNERDWQGFRQTMLRIMGTIALLSVLVLGVSLNFGSSILDYMLHHHSPNGGALISILAVSALIDVAVVPLEPLLTVMGKVYSVLRAKIVTIILYMPVLLVLTHFMGIWGAALASVIASAVMFLWCSIRAATVFAAVYASERPKPPPSEPHIPA